MRYNHCGLFAFLAAFTLISSAGHGSAANYTAPAGCQLTMTVQNRGCTVSQHYVCTSQPEGWQNSVYMDRDGAYHRSTIDAETRWVESENYRSGIVDRLVPNAQDDASFSTLLQTGRDDFDFWTKSNDGTRLRHQGFDRLTGETVTINGQTLERTEFQLTTSDSQGQVLIQRQGNQFISREFGRFFGGVETNRDWTGAKTQTDDSPMLFSFPGDAGFGSTTPQFDCDQLLTQITQERAAS